MPCWFAHVDAGARWERITERQVRVALDELLPRLCAAPAGGACVPTSDGFCLNELGAGLAPPSWEVTGGGLHLSFAGGAAGAPALDAVKWAGDPAPPWLSRGPFVRLEVRRDAAGTRGGLLGGVFVAVGQLFQVAELRRALGRSFENGLARPGRHGLVVSSEIPPPRSRAPEPRDWAFRSVFRCENPYCEGRNADVIVPFSSSTAWAAFERGQTWLPGPFPCPRCPGPAPARWALRWVRNMRPSEAMGGSVLDFPVWPRGTRTTNQAMSVASDAGRSGLHSQWGVDWSPESLTERLEALRPLVSRGMNGPAQFVRTIGRMPEERARLAGLLLSAQNLRALVDHCRTTPHARRVPGVATALAFAFDPRRASRWITEKDAVQQSQDHNDYISLDPEVFVERLFACGANRAGAFLDVGCGTGEKAFLAYALGGFDKADGLEYDPRTVAVGEYLLHGAATRQPYPIRLFCQDALEFDRYGDYDVVYMYRPMKPAPLMRGLVARIAAQMKAGAILMDVLKATTALRKTATGFVTLARPGGKGPWEWTVEAELDALLEYW